MRSQVYFLSIFVPLKIKVPKDVLSRVNSSLKNHFKKSRTLGSMDTEGSLRNLSKEPLFLKAYENRISAIHQKHGSKIAQLIIFVCIICTWCLFSAVNAACVNRLIRRWASLMKESICAIDNQIYPLTSKVTQLSIAFHHTSCLHKISPDPMSCIVCEALICGYTDLTLLLYLLECHGFWPLKPSTKRYFLLIRPQEIGHPMGSNIRESSSDHLTIYPLPIPSCISTIIFI